MKVTMFGATRQVSGSMTLLETDTLKILIDCGLIQTNNSQDDIIENMKAIDFNPSEIDYCILTHAHIDHCGLIPYLIKKGFNGPILCTEPTMNICKYSLTDCAYIWEKEIEKYAKKNKIMECLYTIDEAKYAMEFFRGYGFDSNIILDDFVSLTFRHAGHILGAASLEINVKQEIKTKNGIEYKNKKIIFSGDISGKKDYHPFIQPVEYIEKADYLICESTYGNKKHIKSDVINILTNKIKETCIQNKKTILIASFSVQRLQELIYYLYKIYENNNFEIPIYIDTPMGTNISKCVYSKSYEFFNDEMKEIFDKENIFEWDKLNYVKEYTESLALENGMPKIIIASAGMMQAGRIINHIDSFLPSKNCTIILTGYCAIGTFGRKLLDNIENNNNKIQSPNGKNLTIRAEVLKIDGLSGHADNNNLIKYITNIKGLKKIILNHGEEDSIEYLKNSLQEKISTPIIIANKKNTINLK